MAIPLGDKTVEKKISQLAINSQFNKLDEDAQMMFINSAQQELADLCNDADLDDYIDSTAMNSANMLSDTQIRIRDSNGTGYYITVTTAGELQTEEI